MELSASTRHNDAEYATESEEVRAAEDVVAKLVLAMKQANLYPLDHTISREAINDAARSLADFLDRYGELVLEVRNDGFHYKESPLSSVAGSDDIAHRCHRDGIEWLVFVSGVDSGELRSFVNIVNAHQIIGDEDEGDIVTSLWQADLQGIQYYTDGAIWRNEPLLDLSRFRIQGREREPRQDDSGASGEASRSGNILDPSVEKRLWQLTREEMEQTRRMVEEEENRDHTGDIFDVFLVLLEQQRTKEDVITALGIIKECFEKALARGLFRHTSFFLSQLGRIRDEYARENHWALPHLDDFFQMISGSRTLSFLKGYLSQPGSKDSEKSENLRLTLVQLRPESVEALVPLLPEAGSREASEGIRSAIRELAERDARPLSRLARHAEPEVAKEAIAILSRIGREHVPAVLRDATRSGNGVVRRAAILGLMEQKVADCRELAPFLADPDSGTRNMVFRFLSRTRSREAEAGIAQYIREGEFKRRDAALLLSLYRVLGNCGTGSSEDFLRKRLFSEPFRFGGMRSVHRRGAAEALALLNSSRATELLREASQSAWPPVCRAARRAREHTHAA